MKCLYTNPTPEQCFNCPFPDCVKDDLSHEEYQEDIIQAEIPKSVQIRRMRYNRYARKHREEIRGRSINYYHENKEDCNQKRCEWEKENKGRAAAAKKKRYHENIEISRQKQREYRARIKEREKVR